MAYLRGNKLSINELECLNELLNAGVSIDEAFNLLINDNNQDVYLSIINSLNKGQNINEVILAYLPKGLVSYLSSLAPLMNFKESLSLSLYFYSQQKESLNQISSICAYPLILLCLLICALFFFDNFGLDLIFDLLKSFNININFYLFIRIFLKVFSKVFVYGFLLIAVVLVYFSSNKRIVLLYTWLTKTNNDSLVKSYYSIEFIKLLLICDSLGYKTRKSLEILKSLISKPIVSFLAFHLDEQLNEGNSINEAFNLHYYDALLENYIKIAIHTKDYTRLLRQYASVGTKMFNLKIKRFASIIQIIIYCFIGLIVIFVYLILMSPMKAIGLMGGI